MSQSIHEARAEIEANPDDPRKGTCNRVTFHREDGSITVTLDFPVGESIVYPEANEVDVLLFGGRLSSLGYVARIDEETMDLVFEQPEVEDQQPEVEDHAA